MSIAYEALGEIERLTNGSKLRRPVAGRGPDGRLTRDPDPSWDWFYALDETERAYISRNFMVDGTTRHRQGIGPDDLEDVNRWLEMVRTARKRENRRASDPLEAEYVAACAPETESVARTPMGYAEIASFLGVKRTTVHQWVNREVMPPADLIVHNLPTWWDTTITRWAEVTDRLPRQ